MTPTQDELEFIKGNFAQLSKALAVVRNDLKNPGKANVIAIADALLAGAQNLADTSAMMIEKRYMALAPGGQTDRQEPA